MNFCVEPNFLIAHRNSYLNRMDDGQKTSRGHPDFNSHMKILRVLAFRTDRQMDGTDRDINRVWASLTMFLQVKVAEDWGTLCHVPPGRVRWHKVPQPSAPFSPKFDLEDMNQCSP
jgi:hypothetical protein